MTAFRVERIPKIRTTFLRHWPHCFIAGLKALKSYCGTGLFAMIIHPITFYYSPFLLDMVLSVSQFGEIKS